MIACSVKWPSLSVAATVAPVCCALHMKLMRLEMRDAAEAHAVINQHASRAILMSAANPAAAHPWRSGQVLLAASVASRRLPSVMARQQPKGNVRVSGVVIAPSGLDGVARS